MPTKIMSRTLIDELARRAAGFDQEGGNPRLKAIMHRLLTDAFVMIDDLDISMSEVWLALAYLAEAGQRHELGLIAPGIALEHYLDLRLDEEERLAGLTGGTPRTIEGPLYVEGAPLSQGFARLDDGSDNGEALFMQGYVRDEAGRPLAGAVVDVWHANTLGNYSHFDASQQQFNLRRRIETDQSGRYAFRSVMPRGYSTPPGGSAEALMHALGRHGHRPAHVHFFVSAPGKRHLTTQINIEGDAYLHDDFAFGTREGLIPAVKRIEDLGQIQEQGVDGPFASIDFDFVLSPMDDGLIDSTVERQRAHVEV